MKCILFMATMILSACNMREDKATSSLASGTWFASIQQKILQPNCVGCHSGPGAAKGVDLSSYSALMLSKSVVPGRPEESSLYLTVSSGTMPKGKDKLPQADVDLLSTWILAGAPETKDSGPPPVEVPKATYSWISKNVFEPRCVVCHNSAKPRGKVDLSSYEGLMASEGNMIPPIAPNDPGNSQLLIELVEDKMPPKPRILVSGEVIALHEWIAKGAPEVTPGTVLPGPNQPNPPQSNYEWLSKNIFARRCNSCHGIPFKIAKIDFTAYATLIASPGKSLKALVAGAPESSGIYMEVASGHMPPPRRPVSADEIQLINDWIKDGAQKN